MAAALAVGETRISGLLEGDDVLRTAAALRSMGADIARRHDGVWHVHGLGIGGLHEPSDVLDLGNAGTGVRLLMGVTACNPITVHFTGDESLRRRPMGRIAFPLEEMGASVVARDGDRLPLTVIGSDDLVPIDYTTPVASAQIKSAIIFAALGAPGETIITEAQPTRDHSERLLRQFGANIRSETSEAGQRITVVGQPELKATRIRVPGDPSSAAFAIVAALVTPNSEIRLQGVGINPRRAALFDCLIEMGADLTMTPIESSNDGEPLADIVARSSALTGVAVPPERAPDMIDEFPILAIAAARALGTTRFDGVRELRFKESDRLAGIVQGLSACGVNVEERDDGLSVHGTESIAGGATIDAKHDHRIAMAFLIAGLSASEPVHVDGVDTINTSFPRFAEIMRDLGADLQDANR